MEVKQFARPETLQEAHQLLLQDSKNLILGGGLWMKKSTPSANALIDLANLGLDKIIDHGNQLEIGAMVTLRALELSPLVQELQNGLLIEAVSQIMGVAFRGQATIGGSIAGRFPFSDLITPLLVLDTTLVFYPHKEMTLEAFLGFKGRMSDILTHIIIKKSTGLSFFKKVKTTALDFAILNVAIAKIEGKCRIAVGSRPSVASLAVKAMDIINRDHKLIDDAAEAAVSELTFATTGSSSAEYRKLLAKVYVKRGLEEVSK